jgi:multisubunit Na+/H+ antiporter MnhG subunit
MQDGQCTYNVTLGRVHATTVAVTEHYVLHILSVCIYSLSHPGLFPHYLINGKTFGEIIEHKTRVLIFSTTSV